MRPNGSAVTKTEQFPFRN
jgi:hypothetical protein